MITLKDLKDLVEDVEIMIKPHKSPENVRIKFRTFDDQFDENADEFQLPDTITGVDMDIKNWDRVTITIERNTDHSKSELENEEMKF